MKVIAIVQARLTSSRFPKKILKKINNKSILEILLKRISLAKKLDKIIVAIPKTKQNDKLEHFLKKKKFICFRGSELNVLERYFFAAKKYKADIIVRITSDNPLTDPKLIDLIVKKIIKEKKDYVSNGLPSYPLGLGAEVFTSRALEKIYYSAISNFHKEHVTAYILDNKKKFKTAKLKGLNNYSKYRLTVDEPDDFKVINSIFNYYKPDIYFSFKEIIKLFKLLPKIFLLNKHVIQKRK
tara:strand:+ start:34 stop:753 length:720 start_codon:yes stop_codon:yes gene_type:complete